jgi:phage recombination protein Bet
MSTELTTLTKQLAKQLKMAEGLDLMPVLRATAFKGPVNDAQMTALLLVANQYGLNPWTKEIYAFPDKNNGIVPVVGVDGWSRIINSHSQFNGMSFEQDEGSCTCTIYRKDRDHPVVVTEYRSECARDVSGPWKSHPKRMLRHKAMIQCARLAFGFSGIVDPDEAERVMESARAQTTIDVDSGEVLGFNLVQALQQVNDCNDLTLLAELWNRLGRMATDEKNSNGYVTLKAAVWQRRHELEATLTKDVEVNHA